VAAGSQSLEVTTGPPDQVVMGSPGLELSLGTKG
jgi:hypothetical protein